MDKIDLLIHREEFPPAMKLKGRLVIKVIHGKKGLNKKVLVG
jgi:hypothetical protein